MTHPQFDCDLIAKQKEQELALCRQLLEAQGETIKQQAAVIEQMRGAIGAWERADGNKELQEAEAKLIEAMNAPANLDALHEALAKECERLAKKRRLLGDSSTALLLDIEAAAHRARKEGK